MAMGTNGKVIGSAASVVLGAVIAAVTIVGIVSQGVNSSSDRPGNVNGATVPYGSTQ